MRLHKVNKYVQNVDVLAVVGVLKSLIKFCDDLWEHFDLYEEKALQTIYTNHRVLLPVRAIRLSTNYANELEIGKVEFRGSEHEFAWRESGKPFRKNRPSSPDRDSNFDLPVLGSQAQHETGALANYATEAVYPHLRGERVENHFGKINSVHPTEIRTSISPASAIYCESSALDHEALEVDTDNQRVIIHVKDVNDEPPYFINRPLPMQAVVQLNAPPNTPVFTLQARDPDTDHNIHYFIVRDRTGGRFEVDERSGVVRTRGTDPFQLDMEYVLYVKAEDQNGRVDERRFQSTPEERLSIVGGKRAPQFYMPSYEAEIPENQKKDSDSPCLFFRSIISVKAKSFADREIRYTLKAQGQGAGTFNIGPTSGIVKLAKELDFEDLRQPHVYSLIVTATEDSGGFSTSVELTIRVTDVNDNAPKFELPDYQAHNVDEDIPLGTSILKVKATDSDSGSNAEIEYMVSDDHFSVDSSGIITNNKQLDADNNNAYYEFSVTAKDKGEPSKTGTATVRIYTKNKNDEEPKFSQQVYTPNVDENAGPNTLVTTVVASDKDGDNVRFGFVGGGTSSGQFVHATDEDKGVNGQVKYSIVQQPNQKGTKFTVDEETGEVSTNKVFDREGDDGKFVSVTVKATDQGEPSLEGVCSFTVEITDVNDNPPLFDRQKYVENVKQDASIGTNILRVSASDEDADNNGAIMYTLSAPYNPSDLEYFEIQQESGWIVLRKPLDRERYRLRVRASDKGQPPSYADVDVELDVVDRNNKPPLWDVSVYGPIHIKENVTVGTVVTARENYKLEAMAQDKGYPPLSRTVEVQIDVVDRANNPPVWDHVVYGPIYIKENMPVGAKVVSVKASSGIDGNPTVFYRLMPGSTAQTNKFHTFYLQQRADNGFTWADIKVNHPLDYETIKEYNLTIRVENNGAQQLASEATVFIMLEDVNDEIPLFTEREQETVLEGEPIGTKVTQVNAIDKDGTFPNNQVNAIDKDGTFSNNQVTRGLGSGCVVREPIGTKVTQVNAIDKDGTFPNNQVTRGLGSGCVVREPIGTKVTQVNAIDKDGTFPNNQVTRGLGSGCVVREPIGTKVTQVNAIDKDGTFPNNQVTRGLGSGCVVREPIGTKVTQVNAIDKDGTFPNNQVTRGLGSGCVVREPIGTKVTQVNAIDKDGTFPNNQVTRGLGSGCGEDKTLITSGVATEERLEQSLQGGMAQTGKGGRNELEVENVYYYVVDSPRNDGKDFFEINLQSGEVFTKIVFDREKQGAYALEVEARDGAPSARPNSNGQPNSGEVTMSLPAQDGVSSSSWNKRSV
uniref:Cadherin domain-containing protein n=1 Tax=Timema genevievae TaxID=629358 RepID=A0A7R9JV81_TIMGE|nr:unnamed protein product [Timema genevievae]